MIIATIHFDLLEPIAFVALYFLLVAIGDFTILKIAMEQMRCYFIASIRIAIVVHRGINRKAAWTRVQFGFGLDRLVPQCNAFFIQMTMQMKLERFRAGRIVETLMTRVVFSIV